MGTLPPALLAAIQAKSQGAPSPGMPGDIAGPADGVHTVPSKKKPVKKKAKKKLTPAEKKAALERRMNKSGSSKPNPFASK